MRKVKFVSANDREAVLLSLEEAAQEIADKLAILREVLREDALVCLSETHQQLGEQLKEQYAEPPPHYYELVVNLMRAGLTKRAAKDLATGLMDLGWRRDIKPTLNQNTSTMWVMMNLNDEWQARLKAEVLAEREACAKVVEEPWQGSPKEIAAAIRARGNI